MHQECHVVDDNLLGDNSVESHSGVPGSTKIAPNGNLVELEEDNIFFGTDRLGGRGNSVLPLQLASVLSGSVADPAAIQRLRNRTYTKQSDTI